MELEEDSLVLGIVEKIEHNNVFVKLPDGRTGTLVNSEIAPGRIRNLREYVALNKILVCKVLRISGNNIELSLRRVTAKEKQEVMLIHQQERDFSMGLKSIIGEEYQAILENIKKEFKTISDFVKKVQEDETILDKYIPKKVKEQIKKLTEKKQREVEVKKIIKLKCFDPEGIKKIREIFEMKDEKTKIIYVSAGNYLVTKKAEDYKKANKLMQEFTEQIEEKSKKHLCEITIEDKK